MDLVDLLPNPRIGQYTKLLREASLLSEPTEVQKLFAVMLRDDALIKGFISLSVRGLPKGQYKITRLNINDDLGVISHNPWKEFASFPTHTGGFLGRVISTSEPKIFRNMRITNDPVLGDGIARFGSCFVSPLYDEGEALNWSITFREEPDGYSLSDAEALLMRSNIIGRMTKTLVVAKQVRELNTKLTEQLEQIAQIQRSLLPKHTPNIPGMKIATSYLTSNEAGGDYYDFFEMGHNKLGIMVADVSGHGAGAATMMAMLQTILHDYQDRARGPAAMLEHANRQILSKRLESSFITAYFGVFDTDRRLMTYSNAGHNRPQRRLPDGSTIEIDGAASVPLGVIDDPEYQEATLTLTPDETHVIYTDGITEAFSPPPKREMYGTQRLSNALTHCSGEPLCVIESIHNSLFEHTSSRDRADDQTLVAVRITDGNT